MQNPPERCRKMSDQDSRQENEQQHSTEEQQADTLQNADTYYRFSNGSTYEESQNGVNTYNGVPEPIPEEDREAKRLQRHSFWGGVIAGFMAAVLVVCACYVWTERAVIFSSFTGTAQTEEGTQALTKDTLSKLQLLEDTINTYYYKTDIKSSAEADGMYKGLLESLDDPYSTYYTKDELSSMMSETEGVYYGIGAYITTDTDLKLPAVAGVISGSPAETAGLRTGDVIYKVNDESTQDMTTEELVSKVKGKEGTSVHLTIYREGESGYLEFDITRKKVESPTVKYKMLDDKVGYLQITEFDTVTYDQFAEGLAVLKEKNMKGLILDLRSNPGGNLDTVCNIARQILPAGNIVYTVDRDGKRENYTCDGKNQLKVPIVVLVNGYSASASEILSGAIKDYGIGTLVGTKTYGKGVVQRIFPFNDGTAVKLTVSNYFTPKGNNINKIGIEPDVEVEFDSDAYTKDGSDNQLKKAQEVIAEKIK